jgi:hypothetical protein
MRRGMTRLEGQTARVILTCSRCRGWRTRARILPRRRRANRRSSFRRWERRGCRHRIREATAMRRKELVEWRRAEIDRRVRR